MDRKAILNEILTQTEIMEAAIDTEDFDVFENALEHRGNLISVLESMGGAAGEDERAVLSEIAELHGKCVERLSAMLEATSGALKESGIAKRNAYAAKNKYHDSFGDAGTNIDTKK